MKAFLFLCALSLTPLYSYGRDIVACYNLSNVISMNQFRFDQAEIALSDVNAICKDEDQPKVCAEDLKKEFEGAKAALEESLANFKKAGCEQ